MSIADAVAQLLRAEIAGVLLRDAAGDLEMRCAIGNTRLDTARLRIRAGQGLAGRVMESGRPGADRRLLDRPALRPRVHGAVRHRGHLLGDRRAVALGRPGRGRALRLAPPTGAVHRRGREPVRGVRPAVRGGDQQRRPLPGRASPRGPVRGRPTPRCWNATGPPNGTCTATPSSPGSPWTAATSTPWSRTVGRLTRGLAVVVTEDGRVLGLVRAPGRAPPGGAGAAAAALAASTTTTRRSRWSSPTAPGCWWPGVRAAGVTFGHLALALSSAPAAGDRLAAQHAAVVSALLLAREEAAVAAARRLQSEFVWDLLDGRLPDAVEAGVRARHLGTGFALPARVVAIMVSRARLRRDGERLEPRAPRAGPQRVRPADRLGPRRRRGVGCRARPAGEPVRAVVPAGRRAATSRGPAGWPGRSPRSRGPTG